MQLLCNVMGLFQSHFNSAEKPSHKDIWMPAMLVIIVSKFQEAMGVLSLIGQYDMTSSMDDVILRLDSRESLIEQTQCKVTFIQLK